MAIGKTDFLCTLMSFFCDGFYGFVSFRIPALNRSVTEKCDLKCMHGVAFIKKKRMRENVDVREMVSCIAVVSVSFYPS